MTSAEIREAYLAFFEAEGHKRMPSASLVPAPDDTSTLLNVAGMQPFKPYFLEREKPPAKRLTSCQRCFRTPDIEEVGNTKRHLTYFEMLGNFSFGDYFKADATRFGWELSTNGFGFDPELIWVTVFGGDDELGLGPDTEAVELWRELGLPEERIVFLPRSENFWQAGATGPCGPCSEMYIDRGPEYGPDSDRPGDDTERYLEYWNLVFMANELHDDGSITDLPNQNIDTGLGLERMALIQQGADSVFETDLFRPLIELAEELSGRSYDADPKTTRAMRILADHSRGMVNLMADGVVPSNEDRGYVLRRVMRRAIQQGGVIGLEAPYLGRFAESAIDTLGSVVPQLEAERETVLGWVAAEEESFGRTLHRGSELLRRVVDDAKAAGSTEVDAEEAFKLHDTYGFPFEVTQELLAEEGLEVSAAGFEEHMARQRDRARSSGRSHDADGDREGALEFARSAPPTDFVGFERLSAETSVAAADGPLVKLEESPFYPEGGGQVSDSGILRWEGGEIEVADVVRAGDDQALVLGSDGLEAGVRVEAEVDRDTRHRTMRNHTATHLLHAALRERLGAHVHQAGSAVRPDKLRFDFTHGQPLSPEEVRDIEDVVNDWVKASRPVRAMEMERTEALALGAMALFGEKYGDWVRMVEIDGVSRELCGGTHVPSSAECGIFAIIQETSSAANVRRIEALTGPAAIDWFRERSLALDRAGALLGSAQDPVAAAERAAERLSELEKIVAKAGREAAGHEAEELAAAAEDIGGVRVVVAESAVTDGKALLELGTRVRDKLGDAVVVLGAPSDGKVALVAVASPQAIERGVSAAAVMREAAPVVGGGGGGRDESAQAGGRDPAKLPDALEAARAAIRSALDG
ncbi:MAG: alanyl-tRNA synthetase [Solirubrobacterales bacterium]|jgi:alanyl-tRNA synthetase|nr:alanyl-tRNA synthetase [Solirubrobacterales bacterium]